MNGFTKAFTVTMWSIDLMLAPIAAGQISHADAAVTCDHRGFLHIERHGGKEADDEWHRRHGQSVTCDDPVGKAGDEDREPNEPKHDGLDEPHEDKSHHEDNDKGIKRDHEGFHCTVFGCG